MIRFTRQEKGAALFFGVVAGVVWTGALLNWFDWTPSNLIRESSVSLSAASIATVGDGSIQGVVNEVVAWQAAEAEQVRQLERVEPVAPAPVERMAPQGDCEGIAPGFPAEIAWRESRCTIGIDTGNGYLGYAQIALFHWQSGLCADLTWTDLLQYNECVSRLWNDGAGAAHWAA